MKTRLYLFFFGILLCMPASFAQPIALFPAIQDSRWGYIDARGNVAIPFRYENALPFSDGLAPIRQNGLFGYIDANGRMQMPPIYDYAMPFENGVGRVWKGSKPYFINTKGDILFEHHFIGFGQKQGNFIVARTKSKKEGIIDLSGKIKIDTLYKSIHFRADGFIELAQSGEEGDLRAFMDDALHIIAPMGKFNSMGAFSEGLAKVCFYENEERFCGFIDEKGKVWYQRTNKQEYKGIFSNGLAVLDLCKFDDCSNYLNFFDGVMNKQGKIVIQDTSFKEIKPFYHNRSFAQIRQTRSKWHYRLIDTKGKFVSETHFAYIEEGFESGKALVKMIEHEDSEQERSYWATIDTLGQIVTRLDALDNVIRVDRKLKGHFLALHKNEYFDERGSLVSLEEVRKKEIETIWRNKLSILNSKGKLIFSDYVEHYDQNGFQNGLLFIKTMSQSGYINQNGQWIWKNTHRVAPLNLAIQKQGALFASSRASNFAQDDLGGWAKVNNQPKTIEKAQALPENRLSVLVRPEEKALYKTNIEGMKLYIANATADTTFFDAQDSRLYLNLQAKDENGIWQDIEFLESSWCGNSYHLLRLNPNEFWQFVIPRYDGKFKTMLRAKLVVRLESEESSERILYSNEFAGAVNPAQFWHTPNYYSGGILGFSGY